MAMALQRFPELDGVIKHDIDKWDNVLCVI